MRQGPNPSSGFLPGLQGIPLPMTGSKRTLRFLSTGFPRADSRGFRVLPSNGSPLSTVAGDPFPSCPWPLQGLALTVCRWLLPAPSTPALELSVRTGRRTVNHPHTCACAPPGLQRVVPRCGCAVNRVTGSWPLPSWALRPFREFSRNRACRCFQRSDPHRFDGWWALLSVPVGIFTIHLAMDPVIKRVENLPTRLATSW